MNFKELAEKLQTEKIVGGHRACAGCPLGIIAKTVMAACDKDLVVANATSCMEVTTTIYPYSAWNVPWIHSVFANAAATISGVESAYKALKKKGRIKKEIKFLAFGGDGGSFDIGLQSLSGALERGHNFVYVCYDNEAYQNTGNQRSSATPKGASTTTTPPGAVEYGKREFKKSLTEIAIAHDIPYVAQANVYNQLDLYNKAKKAFEVNGPAVIVVHSPCPTNWKFPSDKTLDVAKLATETNFWPLYEYENGKYKINYKPLKRLPIEELFKTQKRFRSLLDPKNKEVLKEIQEHIDKDWEHLLKKAEC